MWQSLLPILAPVLSSLATALIAWLTHSSVVAKKDAIISDLQNKNKSS